jgi:hypothetical protein
MPAGRRARRTPRASIRASMSDESERLLPVWQTSALCKIDGLQRVGLDHDQAARGKEPTPETVVDCSQ